MDGRSWQWVTAAALATVALVVVARSATGEGGGSPPPVAALAPTNVASSPTIAPPLPFNPLTPDNADRLPVAERAAMEALASPAGTPLPDSHGHAHEERAVEVPLSTTESATFDGQWAAAAAAAAALSTVDDARAAGYVPASVWGGGVGTHWVKWSLVDRPFDAAAPSMLLYDDRPGRPSRLAGFSYWVAADAAPEGFAGPNDEWHRHAGLCMVNGWLDRENVPDPAACAGTWIAGDRLWMLHAWVAPGWTNRWGSFALLHPALCPDARVTPDVERCPVPG